MADAKPNQEREDEHNEDFERFQEILKKLVKVPKEEVDEQRRKYEQERDK